MSDEERIRFKCEACNQTLKAKAKHAGRSFACPHCSAKIRVPKLDGEQAAADDSGLPVDSQPPAGESKSAANVKSAKPKSRDRSTVILKKGPLAKEKQKRAARKLGVDFDPDVSERELEQLIQWAKQNRKERIKEATDKFQAIVSEITPIEWMEEMVVRRYSGLLVLFDEDEMEGNAEKAAQAKPRLFTTEDLSPETIERLLEQLPQLFIRDENGQFTVRENTLATYHFDDDDEEED
ncbi:hypothetical protein LOC68_18680 [Blastopirellula sp. JC732]|uniref:Uncharacterized protein n=1 Tax=Blastopirellula sediminis TaxID=2894196 RepID=A0A9X1MQC7_9BACT|nr:hypothetical protein [Blastopirellula sediminis]MCC9606277.1 hypothetical protein [Blastopirellula sediminis]MCC9630425.1 hypothetical protein [Blastopirellula sediminis]